MTADRKTQEIERNDEEQETENGEKAEGYRKRNYAEERIKGRNRVFALFCLKRVSQLFLLQ